MDKVPEILPTVFTLHMFLDPIIMSLYNFLFSRSMLLNAHASYVCFEPIRQRVKSLQTNKEDLFSVGTKLSFSHSPISVLPEVDVDTIPLVTFFVSLSEIRLVQTYLSFFSVCKYHGWIKFWSWLNLQASLNCFLSSTTSLNTNLFNYQGYFIWAINL